MKAVEAVRRLAQTVGIARRAAEQAAEALSDIKTRVQTAQQELEQSQTGVRDAGASVTMIGDRALALAERVGVVGHEELAAGNDPTVNAHAMLSSAKERAADIARTSASSGTSRNQPSSAPSCSATTPNAPNAPPATCASALTSASNY